MKFLLTLIYMVLMIGLIALASLNAHPVTIDYYVGSREIPLAGLLAVGLVTGVLLGSVTSFITRLKLRMANRRLTKRLQQLELELNQIKFGANS